MRNDSQRLARLRELLILDTPRETAYDDTVRMLASNLDGPIALVNYLDQDRDRFKACVGLPVRESPAATSFCETFLRNNDDVIVVEDTTRDARFSTHPLVQGDPHVRFYAAARLVDGEHTWARFAPTTCSRALLPSNRLPSSKHWPCQ